MNAYEPGVPLDPHVDVAAYLLGVLDEADTARFEEHLAACPACGRQLDELSGMLPVLAELGEAGVPERPAGDAMLGRLLGEVAEQRRGHARRRLVAIASAAVLVIGGPAVAVLATQSSHGPAVRLPVSAARYSAADPVTGARATVGVTATPWGSRVDLRLSGVGGPLTCRLVAVGRDGGRQTVATWSVPAAGYGTSGQPAPLTVQGATGLTPGDIAAFDVVTSDGRRLVDVPL